jgi:hypothetical protein
MAMEVLSACVDKMIDGVAHVSVWNECTGKHAFLELSLSLFPTYPILGEKFYVYIYDHLHFVANSSKGSRVRRAEVRMLPHKKSDIVLDEMLLSLSESLPP